MHGSAKPSIPVLSTFPDQSGSADAADGSVLGAAEMGQLRREFPGAGLRVVIQMFAEEGPVMLEQIVTAAAGGDAGALKRAAHALRGAVANFGAQRLGALCQQIEAAARGGEFPVASQLEQMRAEYGRVELALQQV